MSLTISTIHYDTLEFNDLDSCHEVDLHITIDDSKIEVEVSLGEQDMRDVISFLEYQLEKLEATQ